MSWSSIPIALARTSAVLLALVLACAPFVQRGPCTKDCCPTHSGDCQNRLDLSGGLECARAVPAFAPSPVNTVGLLFTLPANSLTAQPMVASQSGVSMSALLHAPAPLAPTPPLRI